MASHQGDPSSSTSGGSSGDGGVGRVPTGMARAHTSAILSVGARSFKHIVQKGIIRSLSSVRAPALNDDALLSSSLWSVQSFSSSRALNSVRPEQQVARVAPRDVPNVTALREQQPQGVSPTLPVRRRRGEVWLQSLQALAVLLTNAVFCGVCVWTANFLLSRGNVLSGKSSREQSGAEYTTAVVLLSHLGFYATVLCAHIPIVRPWQFTRLQARADPRPNVLFCIGRLLTHTYKTFVVSVVMEVLTLLLLQQAPLHARQLHIEFYIANTWMHLYVTATSIALRRMFLLETAPGQLTLAADRRKADVAFSSRLFWKVYVLTFPKVCAVWLAAAFVQVVSKFELVGPRDFVVFTVGSLVLKHAVKHVAKASAVRLRVKDPRSIFVVAGLPTVLIDTQVRIIVQKMQSNQYTLAWTTATAAFEVAARAARVVATRRQIRRKQMRVTDGLSAAAAVVPQTQHIPTLGLVHVDAITTWSDFERWRRQILFFQIAESYANMSAEYIAIGCSTSAIYFYFGHPKYRLGGNDAAFVSATVFPTDQLTALGIQLLVEVLVDYFSCAMEIAQGVDFQWIQQYRLFLALLFVCFAVVNVQLCSVLYLIVS